MRQRHCVRLIVANHRSHVLLLKHRYEDVVVPIMPKLGAFWLMPGGGIEQGESAEQACHRELWEETGLHARRISPCLWTHELHIVVRGEDVLNCDQYYLVEVESHRVSWENAQPDEHEAFLEYRWWSLEQLANTDEEVSPPGLEALLPPVLKGEFPSRPIRL